MKHVKSILFGSIAALGLSSGFASAADMYAPAACGTVMVGAQGEYHFDRGYDDDTYGYGIGVFGKATEFCGWAGDGTAMQFDVYGSAVQARNGAFGGYDGAEAGTVAHLFYRDQYWAYGALFGIGLLNESYEDYTEGFVLPLGLDLVYYASHDWTLAAQGVYWWSPGQTDSSENPDWAWQVTGEARFFWDENTRVDLLAGYHQNRDNESDYTYYAALVGAGIEHKFMNNWSVFANYEGQFGHMYGDTFNQHAFNVGFIYQMGTDTLLQRDRTGATFATPTLDPYTNLRLNYER